MKLAQLLRLSVLAIVAMFSFSAASAQSPSGQLGVGITTGTGNIGGHVAYAIAPAIHIGTQFGLLIHSDDAGSSNSLAFGPYGKFIIQGTPQFKPFAIVGFGIGSYSVSPDGGSSVSDTKTSLVVAAGAEYFLNRNFGAFGMFNFLDIGFGDASYTDIGLGRASVGIEWFFD